MDTVKGFLEYYSHNWMTLNYMHHLLEGLAEIFSFPLLLRKCNILLSSLVTHIYGHVHVQVKHSSLSIQKSRLSNWTSLWSGPLFGERVKKSQGEGRERVRACRPKTENVNSKERLYISGKFYDSHLPWIILSKCSEHRGNTVLTAPHVFHLLKHKFSKTLGQLFIIVQ